MNQFNLVACVCKIELILSIFLVTCFGGNYPPSGYGIPSHGNGPPTGLPPGVYPGNQRDHPGASAMNSGGIGPPHSSHYPPPGPPPPSTAGQYNYHTSGYYPGNPPPHPPPSNYHQGSRY